MNSVKIKSIIAFLMAMLLFLSACGKGTAKVNATLTEDDIIGDDGRFLYKIIYSNEAPRKGIEETENLQKQISETFDISVRRGDDKINKDNGGYEILVGSTNRKESETALDSLKKNRKSNRDDWAIMVIDKKICIVAVDDTWLAKAVRYFTENFTYNLNDFSKLKKGFTYIFEADFDGKGMTIGGVSAGDYIFVSSKEKSRVWAIHMEELVENIQSYYGYTTEIVKDTLKAEQEYEVLVGDTNRLKQEKLPEKEFKITLDGKKLLINGGSNEAIAAAFRYLISLQEKSIEEGKVFAIDTGFAYSGKVEGNIGYHMAWHDEFNGKELDRTIWRNYNSEKGDATGETSMGGILYKPDTRDCYVENGDFVLPVFRLNHTDFQQAGTNTADTLAARYGIIEIRAKVAPKPIATEFWTAIPNFKLDSNGKRSSFSTFGLPYMELDIIENFSSVKNYATNVHGWWNGGHVSLDGSKYAKAKKYAWTEDGDMSQDYHIYGVEWTPDKIDFTFDGDVFFSYDVAENNADWTRGPQRMQIGVSYASVAYGQQYIPDDAPARAEARIDYWRIYQNDEYDNIMWVSPLPSQLD